MQHSGRHEPMTGRWILRGALVLPEATADPARMDILVEGDRISTVGSDLVVANPHDVTTVDAGRKLVVPGFINAHHHSHDRFDRGRFGPMPLEIWMGLYNPPTVTRRWTVDEVYIRTLIGAMEMIRGGSTTVIDDVHLSGCIEPAQIDAVFRAYDDLGMRADVGIAYSDRPYHLAIPHLEEGLPEALRGKPPKVSPDEMLAIWENTAARWGGRVRSVISVSGPQRCTDKFQQEAWALARRLDRPVLTHVLETRIQALTAERFYGRSMVAHMDALGLVDRHAVMMHGVWMKPGDLDIVARGGGNIVHNPASNLKLGSGVAPTVEMLAWGIPVALGTDNHNANDGCSMIEAVKLAALVGGVNPPSRPEAWLKAKDALQMATVGGATAMRLSHQIGKLAPGMQADMLLFDLDADAFTPLNDARNQLVFANPAAGLTDVIVAGRWILQDGHLTTIDEEAVRTELRDRLESIRERIDEGRPAAAALEPYLRAAYSASMIDPMMAPFRDRETFFQNDAQGKDPT